MSALFDILSHSLSTAGSAMTRRLSSDGGAPNPARGELFIVRRLKRFFQTASGVACTPTIPSQATPDGVWNEFWGCPAIDGSPLTGFEPNRVSGVRR